MKYIALLLGCVLATTITAQSAKKQMDHADIHTWKKRENTKISNDGRWVTWVQAPVTEGDSETQLYNTQTGIKHQFPRGTEPRFSEDSRFLIFRIKPVLDTLKAQRRRKVKEDDLPKDTLAIFTLENGSIEKIARVKTILLPEKWSGWVVYQVEPEKKAAPKKDTTTVKNTGDSTKVVKPETPKSESKKEIKKPKKEDKDNGYRLMVKNLNTGLTDTVAYVKDVSLAKLKPRIIMHSTGVGDTVTYSINKTVKQTGVYLYDLEKNNIKPLWRGKGKYQNLALDENGNQASFLGDTDTTKARIRPWQLYYWAGKNDTAKVLVADQRVFLQRDSSSFYVNEYTKPIFSENGASLYFGIAPLPILNDTTLLPEEIVNVEVWAWTEKRIYTEQEVRLENEKKRQYTVVYQTAESRFVQLSNTSIPELRFDQYRNAPYVLAYTEEPYAMDITTSGTPRKDLYVINQYTGKQSPVFRKIRANPSLSPDAHFILFWSEPDTTYFTYDIYLQTINRLTENHKTPFFNVENDVPDYPNEYGICGWLENDEWVLLYDQYDIWKVDALGKKTAICLTNGRESQTRYRYIKLDPEERYLSSKTPLLLHTFNEKTKQEGYAWLNISTQKLTQWVKGDYAYTPQPLKAKNADTYIYTCENYRVFPDLVCVTDIQKPEGKTISNMNPHQTNYNWGNIELVKWTSLTGQVLEGLLVKPEGFDPQKQYPMIVNFYELLSDELHRHRSPDFHRSQINYTFYASRGYLVFAPDIRYKTGYPGESAYDAIMSGVTNLISRGFVDPKRIALQGHSWGGYQSAYLITRTNLFACAESGAPVANMTSAYGGIRWESGLSRAFQYEHQQSRIGGTLWEYPMRFLENSPLFSLDKVNTPVLIMHNDKDGAVPWYQGIELYSGLRRLRKPAWLLNYNDEPHWPVKLQNRIDFQKRMQQFFDYYLLNTEMPLWMARGVPPIEKGIKQGFELVPKEKP